LQITVAAAAGNGRSSAGHSNREPTLLARAILPSDACLPGPQSGAFITGEVGFERYIAEARR
jgi:hypothetical protein